MEENALTGSYEAFRKRNGRTQKVEDQLVREIRLEIIVNQKAFTTTMCSPGEVIPLVHGLLYSEDVFRGNPSDLQVELRDKQEHSLKALVTVDPDLLGKGYTSGRSLLSVASCGICGKTELEFLGEDALSNGPLFPADQIPSLFQEMERLQHTWSRSGGSHAAAIFSASGNCLGFAEDIGRHNAVDKSIGQMRISAKDESPEILLVSSRISYEIVAKCFTARIPILAAVSASSSLAVDFAKELGITLLAFCREDRFSVYSHPDRLQLSNGESLNIELISSES